MPESNQKRSVDWFYFQGKAGRNRIQEPDLEFNTWYMQLYLNPASIDLFKKLQESPEANCEGILNQLKSDNNGEFAYFRRPMVRKWNGTEKPLSPPVVLDKDDKPTNDFIGLGSDVTVKVERYKFRRPFGKGRGSAIRLLGIKIDNLIPAEIDELSGDQQKNAQ